MTAQTSCEEGKLALRWTRLSCHAFRHNAVRLQLFGLAYNLANFLRSLVDRLQRLMPAFDLGQDRVRLCGPDEWLGCLVVLGEVAVDRGLRSTSEWNTPRRRRRRVSLAKKPSTAFNQDAEVGVKWKLQRSWRLSQARTLGCLWVA